MSKKTGGIRHNVYDDVLMMAKAGVPTFLVGPAGTGKTTIGKNVADELELDFYYAGSVESPFQLRGFLDAQGRLVKTPFRTAYEQGGLFLFDELDASDPQAIVTVHAALDNGLMDCPDGMVERHENFRFLAAGNTWGNGASLDYIGRNALDGATLDRYAFMHVDYDPELEAAIAKSIDGDNALKWAMIVQQARGAVRDLELRHIVSTRAIRDGAKLIKAGMPLDDVFARTVIKGLSPDDAVKVKNKIDFRVSELAQQIEHVEGQKHDMTETFIAVERLLKRVEGMQKFLATHNETIESVEGAREEIEGAAQKIEQFRTGLSEITESLETSSKKFNDDLSKAERTARRLSERQENVDERLEALVRLSERLEKLTNDLTETEESLATKHKEAGSLSEKMTSAARGIIATIADATDALETIEKQARRLKTLEPAAEEIVTAAQAGLAKLTHDG